jgi:hypothetical protein
MAENRKGGNTLARKRQLYILVSQTQTGIARMIRGVCRYPYNHVSVTLDPGLSRWYSFARYVQDAPLHGGLVSESPRRLCAPDGDILVRVYRVAIPEKRAARLEGLLAMADDPASGLIYNHFDAMASVLGFRLNLPRCYTCLSFACEILGRQYMSIRELCQDLEQQKIYEGPMSRLVDITGEAEEDYFVPGGLLSGTAKSAAQLGRLTVRTIHWGYTLYLAQLFRKTAQ